MYVIFLDLHKAYDALYKSRCLEILEGYGVGTRSCRILRTYWSRLRMVAKAGGYYEAKFKGARGVIQGDPLSPTIFNVVVDAVVQHLVSVMLDSAEEWGGHGQECRHQNALFYAYYGVVSTPDPQWIQGYFSTLVGLIYRVGLKNNARKTVRMVFHLCQSAGTQLEAVYGIRMIGTGPLYRERWMGRNQCKECGDEMAPGSLAGHMHTQNVNSAEGRWRW